MAKDELAVFYSIANCVVGSYTAMYAPDTIVVSTSEVAHMLTWKRYRARKAIKGLVEHGMIERASVGRPAVESCGEYQELVCEAMPPKNGYAITEKGFASKEWKGIYDKWCKSMEDWANGFLNG